MTAEVSIMKVPNRKPFTKVLLNIMAEVINRMPEVKREKPHLFKTKPKKKRLLSENEPIKPMQYKDI